jgi:hypothetical protein
VPDVEQLGFLGNLTRGQAWSKEVSEYIPGFVENEEVDRLLSGFISNTPFLLLKKQFDIDQLGSTNIDLSRQDMASYYGTKYEIHLF